MKRKILVATAIVMAMGIGSASAQIRKREKNQHARIAQGVRSGELTKAETKNVVSKEKDVRQDVKAAKSDGVVTNAERKEIRRDQNKASRTIYRKKHNNRERN